MKGKIFAEQHVPGVEEIYKVMLNRRFSSCNEIVHNLVHTCAEEAHNIMMQAMRPTLSQELPGKKPRFSKILMSPICPVCELKLNPIKHNHCPQCDLKIDWT